MQLVQYYTNVDSILSDELKRKGHNKQLKTSEGSTCTCDLGV
jgi:hypothetical protein